MEQIIHPVLEDYAHIKEGKWLTEFDYKAVKLGKLPFVINGLFVAMYLAIFNKVLVEDPETTKETFDVWFTDVVHEFRHAYQRHKYGLIGYLLRKIFMRKSIEKDAENISLEWLDLQGINTCLE